MTDGDIFWEGHEEGLIVPRGNKCRVSFVKGGGRTPLKNVFFVFVLVFFSEL